LAGETAAAGGALSRAESAYQEAVHRERLFAARAGAGHALQEQELRVAGAAATEARLEAARRAEVAWPAGAERERRQSAWEQARRRNQEARQRVAATTLQLLGANEALNEAGSSRPERERLVAERGQREAWRPVVQRLAEQRRAMREAEQAFRAAEGEVRTRLAERTALEARLPELERLADAAAGRAMALVEARQRLEQRRSRERWTQELAETAPRAAAAEQAEAAALAERLREGEACPVCGSTAHPNPAVHHGGGAGPSVVRTGGCFARAAGGSAAGFAGRCGRAAADGRAGGAGEPGGDGRARGAEPAAGGAAGGGVAAAGG
jgi:exonuclease SbcC